MSQAGISVLFVRASRTLHMLNEREQMAQEGGHSFALSESRCETALFTALPTPLTFRIQSSRLR